ncbi:MAG: hypothetical protein QXT31_07455 [Candidatus Bathyarchaeia archaeon]
MGRKKIVLERMPLSIQKRIRETLKKGELTKHGYSLSLPEDARRAALSKAVAEDGALTIFKRLNLLYIWNKNRNPSLAEKAKEDRDWVGKTYGVEVNGFKFTA